MFTRRVLPVLAVMAAVGAAWAGVLIIGLLAGVRLLPMAVAAPVAVALVVPCFVASVVTLSLLRKRPSEFLQLLGHLPRWALVLSGGLFFAFWLAAMTTSFSGMGGNAGIRDGQYVLDNHGRVTVVDEATYYRQLALEERLALGVLGAFGVASATLAATPAVRARSVI